MKELDQFDGYISYYIGLAADEEMIPVLRTSMDELMAVVNSIPESRMTFAYDEGKWTIAQLLVHLADCERVFQYRALSFSRGDTRDLLPFDHDGWVPESEADLRSKSSILTELESIRESSIALYAGMTTKQLDRLGKASGIELSARAIAYHSAGHMRHHLKILKERYL